MKKLENSKEEKINGERNCIKRIVVFVVMAFLAGFLTGFLFHDHLTRLTPDRSDWKSWYPR